MSATTGAPSSRPSKVCFVTIGATASFSSLIQAVTVSAFLKALEQQGYTELIVQYGADGESYFNQRVEEVKDIHTATGVKITGFGLDQRGLGQYMVMAKTGGDGGVEGVVISHAGMTET